MNKTELKYNDMDNDMSKEENAMKEIFQELIEKGTPREKALFFCKKVDEMEAREMYGAEPLLTKSAADILKKSLATESEREQFIKWQRIFQCYLGIVPYFGLGRAEYTTEAVKMEGYLIIWKMYDTFTETLNAIFNEVKETGNKELWEKLFAAIKKLQNFIKNVIKFDSLKQNKDGTFCIDISGKNGLYEKIKDTQETLISSYQGVKSIIFVIEEFARKTDSKDFIPTFLEDCIADVKAGYKTYNIDPCYSRRELRLRKQKGEEITKEEEAKAVFPEYGEIKLVPEQVKFSRAKFREIQKKHNIQI